VIHMKDNKGCTSCEKAAREREAIKQALASTGVVSQIKKFAKGVPGAIKSNFGFDQAPDLVVSQRREKCESCKVYDFGICDESKGGCGCVCAWKVRLLSESCPLGKWG